MYFSCIYDFIGCVFCSYQDVSFCSVIYLIYIYICFIHCVLPSKDKLFGRYDGIFRHDDEFPTVVFVSELNRSNSHNVNISSYYTVARYVLNYLFWLYFSIANTINMINVSSMKTVIDR